MLNNQELLAKIAEVDPYVRAARRYFHENPEISLKEFNTSKYCQAEIKKIDPSITIEMVDETGFVAILDTGRPGKTIGIRTDIDALPVVENPHNLAGPRTCLSKINGAMHACGHDGHMAMELGVITILSSVKNQLSGKIMFIFEAAEEIGVGVNAMITHLKKYKIDAIYGTHVTSFMKSKTVCLDEGPRMAGMSWVVFEVKGRGGHGSRPDLSINPVFATAAILQGIATAWPNQLNVEKTVTLGITQVHVGTANNIFADICKIGGSLRYFDHEEGVHALEVIKNVAINTAKAHQCEVLGLENFKPLFIPVINDPELSRLARTGMEELFPGALVSGVKWYASESFSRYREIAPICLAFVGTGNAATGSGAEHHNEYFDLDEDCLQYGVGAATKFALEYLR